MRNTSPQLLFLSHYGANQQFQDWYVAIAALGYRVTVIVPKHIIYPNGYTSLRFSQPREINGVSYIPSRLWSKRHYNLSGYFPELPLQIHKLQPDAIIVTDDVYTRDVSQVIRWRKLLSPASQIVCWGQAKYLHNPSYHAPQIQRRLQRNLQNINKLVARNKYESQNIQQYISDAQQVRHMYWGTDTQQFYPRNISLQQKRSITGLDIHDTDIVISFLGRIVPEKGVLELVHAIQQLPSQYYAQIVGSGKTDYLHRITAYIQKHHLQHRIHIIPAQPYNTLPDIYAAADLVILPTLSRHNFSELFGRVLAEAMLTRTLVLGSDNGSIPEVIGNPQCIFPEADIAHLAGYIQRLIDLPASQKQAILDNNYQRALQQYTVQVAAQSLSDLIAL